MTRVRGHTLPDLLAGVAVGLVVVAATLGFTLAQVRDDRAATLRARLLRELRMASDVIARDLRRAGHWDGMQAAAWRSPASGPSPANPYAAFAPGTAASDAARFAYAQTPGAAAVSDDERLGFRLRRGVVEMMLGQDNWQAVTDAASVVVTRLAIAPAPEAVPLEPLCALPCGPDVACGPVQTVRRVAITVRGHAAAAPAIERTLERVVHVRNDVVDGGCPETP